MDKLIQRHRLIMFAGPPGAGKGTQANILKEDCNNKMISNYLFDMGQSLRNYSKKEESIIADYISKVTSSGKGSAAFLTIFQWTKALSKIKTTDEPTLLIFDGVCRKDDEVIIFANAINALELSPTPIILLEMSEEKLKERFEKRGREDDIDHHSIKNRINQFFNETLPTIEKLGNKEGFELIRVNGDQTIEEVHDEIISKIKDFFHQNR